MTHGAEALSAILLRGIVALDADVSFVVALITINVLGVNVRCVLDVDCSLLHRCSHAQNQ